MSDAKQLSVGVIGAGGIARSVHLPSLNDLEDVRIVAICDIYKPYFEAFNNAVDPQAKWNAYTKFDEMYDKENLDGVLVETTTHARAWVTIKAMQAGMDVYIEKPMSLTIAEGREMVNAARKYDRVTQVGTQQRSMPINNWASDLVKNGALGKVHTVLAPNFISPDYWDNKPAQPMPEGTG